MKFVKIQELIEHSRWYLANEIKWCLETIKYIDIFEAVVASAIENAVSTSEKFTSNKNLD